MSESTPPSVPWIGIAPMRSQLVPAYHQCLDSVCREKTYLMMTEAPAIELSQEFVQSLLDAKLPMFVAFVPGPTVIGWCDIYSPTYDSRAHIGILGLGVRRDFRGQGLGTVLMDCALKQARLRNLERVELEVLAGNENAIRLYRKFEFVQEGVKRRARKLDGSYEDIVIMARLF